MAMMECKECKAQISTKAEACPNCGAKVKRTSRTAKAALVLVLLVTGFGVYQSHDASQGREERIQAEAARRASLTPEQRKAEDAKAAAQAEHNEKVRAATARAAVLANTIKKEAKDPASMDVAEALVTPEGAAAIKFRAKNSFGALVINYAVMAPNGKMLAGTQQDVADLWNKHIAHQRLSDVTSEVRAMMR